jgi:hypothetical protein
MRKTNTSLSLLSSLAKVEEEAMNAEFVAIVRPGGRVLVKVGGVPLILPVDRADLSGFGVFIHDGGVAKFVREAGLQDRRKLLDSLPIVRLIACFQREQWRGIQASDGPVKVNGIVPIFLPGAIRQFDTVVTRFDGQKFWYDRTDRLNAISATSMRADLEAERESPSAASIPKTSRRAYQIAYAAFLDGKRDRNEERLKAAVERAGAAYKSYSENPDHFVVEFEVLGERIRSVVDKTSDLNVVASGICLSGQDEVFDIQSLVSVIAEGKRRGLIHHVPVRTDPEDDE